MIIDIVVSAYTMSRALISKCIVRLYKDVSQQEKRLVIVSFINILSKKKRNENIDNQNTYIV